MKVLIIYDSVYGNTEKIGLSISKSFGKGHIDETKHIKDITPGILRDCDLLIAGTPTQGFRPTKAMTEFLDKVPRNGLKGIKVAAFDTRISVDDVDSRFLRIMVKVFGYAADPLARKLQKKGGNLIISPEGFYVGKTEGPLKKGEIERAAEWGRSLVTK